MRVSIHETCSGRKHLFWRAGMIIPRGVLCGRSWQDAFVHAVEIRTHQRQQGVASWLMKQAAFWAAEQGASRLNVACTKANVAANALYRSIGMKVVGEYHYRMKG